MQEVKKGGPGCSFSPSDGQSYRIKNSLMKNYTQIFPRGLLQKANCKNREKILAKHNRRYLLADGVTMA